MLGLFLLGMISRRARSPEAATAVVIGVLVILWLSLSQASIWPTEWSRFRTPLHPFMTTVVGTLTILLTGMLLSRRRRRSSSTKP